MTMENVCDMRIFGKGVKIGLPETRIGAVAAVGGVQKLIRHVHCGITTRMIPSSTG